MEKESPTQELLEELQKSIEEMLKQQNGLEKGLRKARAAINGIKERLGRQQNDRGQERLF